MLVEHEHIGAALQKSVCGRETCETTADDDNLGHVGKGGEMDAGDDEGGLQVSAEGRKVL